MTRKAEKTATILMDIYKKEFSGDFKAPFSLTWQQLKEIAGIDRLNDSYLAEINERLLKSDHALLTFNNKFLVAKEEDFNEIRPITARFMERHLDNEENEDDDWDDDDENDKVLTEP